MLNKTCSSMINKTLHKSMNVFRGIDAGKCVVGEGTYQTCLIVVSNKSEQRKGKKKGKDF